jgi:hypothetical protein
VVEPHSLNVMIGKLMREMGPLVEMRVEPVYHEDNGPRFLCCWVPISTKKNIIFSLPDLKMYKIDIWKSKGAMRII